MPTWLFPFLALLVAVQLHLIARSANPVAAQLRHRWRATLPRPKATLRSSSRRVFLIEMLPHLISANPVAVQLLLACLRCCCLICTSCLLCRECANPDAAVQTCCFCFRCCCCFLFFFLLSFLIVVLLLELLSTDTVVNQFDHLRRFSFFSSLLSSLLSPVSLLLDP